MSVYRSNICQEKKSSCVYWEKWKIVNPKKASAFQQWNHHEDQKSGSLPDSDDPHKGEVKT